MRNGRELGEALESISKIHATLDGVALTEPLAIETYNIATVAIEILKAAIARKHSVGAHFRTDAPPLGEGK